MKSVKTTLVLEMAFLLERKGSFTIEDVMKNTGASCASVQRALDDYRDFLASLGENETIFYSRNEGCYRKGSAWERA